MTLKIDRAATAKDPDARAHWDDLTDTLCVRAFTGFASAEFVRPNGNVVDLNVWARDGRKCTGNLSIREDYRTTLYLRHYRSDIGWRVKSVGFYT
ncbi:MAG: hypothetical protein GEV07_15500 [Streptosporangiales bacterium]|nr:hypothetical protein [Streptosporangiales bacterium]